MGSRADTLDRDRRREQLRAVGPLAARYADETLLSTVEGVHRAVAMRAFGAVGPAATTVRATHDAIMKGVYGALRGAGRAIGAAAGATVAASRLNTSPGAFSDSPTIAPALAAINGLIGDRLLKEGNALAYEMGVRRGGRDVAIDREALARAYPRAGSRIAIFVHGLMETEDGWRIGSARPGADDSTYGSRLQRELGLTPVYLRYNTGLRISENARRLSWLLDELRREWPVPITEIVLIGHSMGALIARGACHEASEHERPWLGDTTHLICLGAPNRGSWLEQAVNGGSWALGRLPEARPFGDFLNLRSVGIRDLRFGFVRDSDWGEREPDDLHLRDDSEPFVPCRGVEYHYVTGSLRAKPGHPLNSLFGDALVSVASGTGPRLAPDSKPGDFHHVPGASHFRLLNDPRVYQRIRGWLERPEPEPYGEGSSRAGDSRTTGR